ncbi:hypothetical protein INS49_000512 [Diaporthe citri]|uniref:uncharacterized protein n=1 Tax=Diaporthe citri TaxID=83186 RepID=UPI001C7ED84E|nr:uncharacterized protein INS49_000512 [Diaporthe citri]KAG6366335.1 hypothetical protein INS49_000512 [Diaporthe citri]
MSFHEMEERPGSAAALSSSQGPEALTPGDSSSPSPGLDRLTPESSGNSSNGDLGREEQGMMMGPLLSNNDSSGDDEIYELDERGSRETGRDYSRPRNGFSYAAEEERAVVDKFDRRLVLFVAFLYMLSFLDRSKPADTEANDLRIDIGNAYVAGMDDDLTRRTAAGAAEDGGGAGGKAYYEWALASFYIAYILFEWMSLLWSRVPAHAYVAGIVLSWGAVASLQAVATSYPVLIVLRFLLGVGEAGFTGIPIYLSFFFRREELALRTAVFISAAPLATTFASSLAWLITKFAENGPIAPWRLLFLVEGFPAVLVSTMAWRIIPDSPEKATYLTRREKKIARLRLSDGCTGEEKRREDPSSASGGRRRRCGSDFWTVLRDPVPWTTAAIFLLTNIAYSSLPVFLPSILTQMGHTPVASQALSVPPYLISFVAVLAVAKASDALQSRAYLIAACALSSALGYAFLALSHRLSNMLAGPGSQGSSGKGWLNMARYLAIYPAAAGFFCVVVLTIAWNVNNSRGRDHKGAGFALMQVIGQTGPLIGTRLYPKGDGPWFTSGMGICAAAMFGVAGLALGLRAYLARANRRGDGDGAGGSLEEEERLFAGDKSDNHVVRFRYML